MSVFRPPTTKYPSPTSRYFLLNSLRRATRSHPEMSTHSITLRSIFRVETFQSCIRLPVNRDHDLPSTTTTSTLLHCADAEVSHS